METELNITDNEFQRQFECEIDGELTTIEYAQQDRKIFLTKLSMSENLQEKGFLEPFIEKVLDIIKERDTTKVMPTSPVVAKFMRKNRRKYKELLPVGINI